MSNFKSQITPMRELSNRLPPPKVSDVRPRIKVDQESAYSLPSNSGSLVSLIGNQRTKNDGKHKFKWLKLVLKCAARVVVVAVYLVVGAFMFQYLELTNETNFCYQTQALYLKLLNSTLNRFVLLYQLNPNAETLNQVTTVLLSRFGEFAYMYQFDPFRNCSAIGQPGATYTWSFPNALMYSLTIVSTIGYGYVYPLTNWGKMVTVAYAVLGIPITVICLIGIGDILSRGFRYVYANLCCCNACKECRKASHNRVAPSEVVSPPSTGNWTNGLSFTASANQRESQVPRLRAGTGAEEALGRSPDSFEVPITFLFCLVVAVLFIGVGVFVKQSWDLLDSVYFCFVSLATIGFGDLVPDRKLPDTPQLLTDTVVSIVYILVGMALLSMCLNLIQDDIVDKTRWVMAKLRCKCKRCCKSKR